MHSSKHWLLRRSHNWLNFFENQMLRETKENVQGTNSDAKETGTQINGVDQKEERNIQPEKNEEFFQEFGKMRRPLETSRTS